VTPALTPVMRALVFDRPAPDTSATRVAKLHMPQPGPGQIAINVHYAGVNFKDVMVRRGDPGYAPAWPCVPGLEVSGTIRTLGDGVTSRQIGQRVSAYTGAGGLAEVTIADAALTAPVPPGLDLARAAVAPGALTSAALLLNQFGRLRAGEAVLVHGAAGGVGQAAAHLGRQANAGLMLGTVGNPGRIEAARRAGYDDVLTRGEDWPTAARAATDGRGVHLILDPQGTTQLELDLRALAPGGRILLFGNASGGPLAPLPPLSQLMTTNATITGFSLAALTAAAPDLFTEALTDVLAYMESGDLDIEMTVVAGLHAAAEAQEALAQGSASGKQVVRVNRGPSD